MTDARTPPVAESACCSRSSEAQSDANAPDRPSSGASLGRGLAPEGAQPDIEHARMVSETDLLALPRHLRLQRVVRPSTVDRLEEVECVDWLDVLRVIQDESVESGAPEGERRPPAPNIDDYGELDRRLTLLPRIKHDGLDYVNLAAVLLLTRAKLYEAARPPALPRAKNGGEVKDRFADRTPRDGRPYYCSQCGAGFYEFMACEEADCLLEPASEAQARRVTTKKPKRKAAAPAPTPETREPQEPSR